jgi:plastocyanin
VRTAATALLTAALIAALPATGGDSSAAAAECSWQRHAKRVVKHVRRHGRLRKVVRRKTRWTCDPVATPLPVPDPSPLPVPTLLPSEAPPVEAEPEPEANRLAVKSQEYYFVLSRPKVKAGELTVELNNQGEDAHDLDIRREGDADEPLQIPETASLGHNVVSFDLPPGTYRLWCSLPGHEEKGMHTTLVVE